MMKAAVVGVVLAGVCMASEAHAQMVEWKDRGFINVSGGVQTGSKDVASQLAFTLYDETATVDTNRTVDGGAFWDVTAGARVWKNLAVAVSVSGRSANSDGTAVASVPHPIFYEQPRSVTSTISGMEHKETWGAILAAWMFPVTEKFDVMVFGGPAVAKVDHEVVGAATIQEAAIPGVTVTLDSVSKSVWGVSAGLDARYMVSQRIGLGAFARYSAASVNLSSTSKLDVGGFQVGGGVRVRF